MAKSKVIIIGAGFGGLNAAQWLKRADVDLLIIDKSNHHLFQPLLYQVATAALSPGNIAAPIREILARQKNTRIIMAEVTKIRKEQKIVEVGNGDCFPYDFLIVAPGARHSYFSHPEWEKIAPGLKTADDALILREKILLSFEHAERCESAALAAKFLRFVIIGGGPTGVELAGAIAEIARKSLIRNFRNIQPEQSKIFLIEGENQLLPAFPPHLAQIALADLEKMGVEVLLNAKVTQVEPEGVYLGQQFLASPNIIWAAGNVASPLLKTLDVPLDRAGRVKVNSDLSLPNYPELFVIGDAACVLNAEGKPLPAIAPVAIQQGRYVSQKITSHKKEPFRYVDKGTIATIGKAKAVGFLGKQEISGYFAWLVWSLVHIYYLIGFPDRVMVLFQWAYWYLTNQRSVRLITRPVEVDDFSSHDKST